MGDPRRLHICCLCFLVLSFVLVANFLLQSIEELFDDGSVFQIFGVIVRVEVYHLKFQYFLLGTYGSSAGSLLGPPNKGLISRLGI